MAFGVTQPRQHDLVLGIQGDGAGQPAVRLLPLRASDRRLLLPVVGDDQIGEAEQTIANHGIGAHMHRGVEQRPARELHAALHDAVDVGLVGCRRVAAQTLGGDARDAFRREDRREDNPQQHRRDAAPV